MYYYKKKKNDELMHYGVKGMKWGVRRYQNKDGSLTAAGIARNQKLMNKQASKGKARVDLTQERTIPAGTKMHRTSTDGNESLKGSTYVSYLDVDRNHYKGGYVRIRDKSDTSYEHEYALKEDLKLPSRKTQQDVINEVVRSNQKYMYESVKSWVDQAYPEGSWNRSVLEEHYGGDIKKFVDSCVKQWGNNSPAELPYSVSQSLGLAPNVKKEIIRKLQNKGYNAMVDEASVGGQNGWAKEGYDPLILFDSDVLSNRNTRVISRTEENKALYDDQKWRSKVNSSNSRSAQWSAIS